MVLISVHRRSPMLSLEEWMDIKNLERQGHSIRSIAQLSGHSRNTVRRLLRQGAPQPFQNAARTSKLDPYKEYVVCQDRSKIPQIAEVKIPTSSCFSDVCGAGCFINVIVSVVLL